MDRYRAEPYGVSVFRLFGLAVHPTRPLTGAFPDRGLEYSHTAGVRVWPPTTTSVARLSFSASRLDGSITNWNSARSCQRSFWRSCVQREMSASTQFTRSATRPDLPNAVFEAFRRRFIRVTGFRRWTLSRRVFLSGACRPLCKKFPKEKGCECSPHEAYFARSRHGEILHGWAGGPCMCTLWANLVAVFGSACPSGNGRVEAAYAASPTVTPRPEWRSSRAHGFVPPYCGRAFSFRRVS